MRTRIISLLSGAACGVLIATAPAHALTYGASSSILPSGNLQVELSATRGAVETAPLSIDILGSGPTGVFNLTPAADLSFTSAVFDTDSGSATYSGDGAIKLGGVFLSDLATDVPSLLFRFALPILPSAKPGAYVFVFDFTVDDGTGPPGQASTSFTIVETAPVPEPSTWALMLAGLIGLGAMLRRRAA